MVNKFKLLVVPVILLASISLTGCNSNQGGVQNANTNYQVNDFLKYKGSYVGDNSAVGNILSNLPAHDYLSGFSLQTAHTPYGITVHYTGDKSGVNKYNNFWSNHNPNKLLQKNAAVLFFLVKNADVITFNVQDIGHPTYRFTRADIQEKYGDLSKLFNAQSSLGNFLSS